MPELPEPGQDHDDLLSRFEDWDRLLDAHWSKWREDAREDYDFVAGNQWSDQDKALMEERNRLAIVINRTAPIVDAVSGAEIQNKQRVQYYPREIGDAQANEVWSRGADWIRDECDADEEESDASWDVLVCGMGWTETRPDYDRDPDGAIDISRVDPLEMAVDPSSRKSNCVDARYLRRERKLSREAFDEMFPGFTPAEGGEDDRSPVVVDPRHRYESGESGDEREGEVTLREYQWFEMVPFVRLVDGGEEITADEIDFEERLGGEDGVRAANATRRAQGLPEVQFVRQRRKVFRRAFVGLGAVIEVSELEVGGFTYEALTGKRDRNRGVWFGLVRSLKDPQRLGNKLMSQLDFILSTNAKGGLLAETDAFEDQRQAEASWAQADTFTWVRPGALSGGKVQPKQPPQLPQAIPLLLQLVSTAPQEVTGVNQEMLGLADRQQPGVLEDQRKQAAFGILAPFFKSFRRYRKNQGRLLLETMRRYLPEGTLVRIVGDEGARYVPLAFGQDFKRFDVIVDDAPSGPNQKQRIFAVLTSGAIGALLQDAPPEIIAEVIRYSPLPAAFAEKLAGMVQGLGQDSQPDPAEQAQVAKIGSEIERNRAVAAKEAAVAQQTQAGTALGVVQ